MIKSKSEFRLEKQIKKILKEESKKIFQEARKQLPYLNLLYEITKIKDQI
jgi:hypothetical protein